MFQDDIHAITLSYSRGRLKPITYLDTELRTIAAEHDGIIATVNINNSNARREMMFEFKSKASADAFMIAVKRIYKTKIHDLAYQLLSKEPAH